MIPHSLEAVAVGGINAQAMADAAQEAGPGLAVLRAANRDHALALTRGLIQPGDIVLVKGSHSVGLERTAERLALPDATDGGGESAAIGRTEG
ncbi:hypothetical protein AB0C52_23905 [Streptomyces sp. NPDC048717]|uniref:hypothetical protein n=1 Tax=Streptomyces sp. NPDC048717 TaxID=3154928 RepID=UPI0034144449